MYVAFYLENGEIPSIVGKYWSAADAADAIAAKEQTVTPVNPYWMWIEEQS